ncbi:MAG: hypothetical protein JKY94_17470 [Rhodobacteraceae bacterium]|nr:hypothetical protein [Paracoccaceae bacterium]
MTPGFKTTEFWLVVLKLLIGAGLAAYEPTRVLGAAMLGLGGPDVVNYTKERSALKKG